MRIDDTRGILHPARMLRDVTLERYPAPQPLAGLVDWLWSVRWRLPPGVEFAQDVASQPGVNLSVGPAPPPGDSPPAGPFPSRWVLNGVSTGVTRRVLRGFGWNVAAKTTTGGFGAWVDDVSRLTNQVFDGAAAIAGAGVLAGLDRGIPSALADGWAAPETGVPPNDAETAVMLANGADAIADELIRLLDARDPARVAEAREVAEVAHIAERDRAVRRVDELAAAAGVSVRTLQRRFASCAGVSPLWVIRRFRLLDAAELARDGGGVDWAGIAAELGYADQAHLTRDFRAALGDTPAAYARAQRP
ncbi:AraC family transcriptional regulator [Pseudoclavibacter endophyticus]|nr:AraC family transcriptional regulator [Pseudoclavibacter endophyticus]